MYMHDRNEMSITKSERERFCPICGSLNNSIHWDKTIFIPESTERVKASDDFYHCNRCGYFERSGISDNYMEYEPEVEEKEGISIMRNPLKAIRQIFVLRKYSKHAHEYELLDYKWYELRDIYND